MAKHIWTTEGFEAFRRGTFGNGGQNLYVSKKGILQRIFQYDLDRNGYVDLVYANCQNHHESVPSYVYNQDGVRTELPGQGALSGMALDIDGDGHMDLVVTGFYDMAAPFASTDVYYGGSDGWSENRRIRIPTPYATDCCHGDFNGSGKPALVFALPLYKTVRIFDQTELGLEWTHFTDLSMDAYQVAAADLNGDGYDDLIIRAKDKTETTVYWGSKDGLSTERCTVLPELPASEILQPEEEKTIQSEMEKKENPPRLLQTIRWNGRNCFTLSTGKKLVFWSAEGQTLECVLSLDIPMAMAVAAGDIDGDGYEDLAVATLSRNPEDPKKQCSYLIWNGPDGLDRRPRTALDTQQACDAAILENKILIGQCCAGRAYTNDSLLFTWPELGEPQKFEGEDTRRCALFRDAAGVMRVFLINHFARSSIGFQQSYVYWGDETGYDPQRRLEVPSHCAVDALIADLDDDGWAELLIGNNSENAIHLDVGHHIHHFGPEGFQPERSRTIRTDVGWGVTAGDFDHDGYLEIATPGSNLKTIRIFHGRTNFETYDDIPLMEDSSGRWPVAIDLNGDGWLDLVVPTAYGKYSLILWGGPEGFSMERSQKLSVFFGIGATAADLTKNGYPDLIIGGHTLTPINGEFPPHMPHHSFVNIYWNGPDGIKESNKCVLRGDAADSFAVADFNNDGWLDLFVGSYHGGKDRDINSFLYWNREGKFRELDRDLLYTHSASGCMAADFNEDGYVDLAVANHKVDGDHHGWSAVWWNGPKGFNSERCTKLPTNGPHGMISTEIGNIMDRSDSEYYYSEAYAVEADCTVSAAFTEGDVPPKTWANLLLRVNDGDWQTAEGLKLQAGDKLQYRLELKAKNCCRTPRIEKVVIEFDA